MFTHCGYEVLLAIPVKFLAYVRQARNKRKKTMKSYYDILSIKRVGNSRQPVINYKKEQPVILKQIYEIGAQEKIPRANLPTSII